MNPWDLMVHAQAAHMVNIYEIGESDEEDDVAMASNSDGKGNKLDKANGESHNNTNNVNGSSCNGTTLNTVSSSFIYFWLLLPAVFMNVHFILIMGFCHG